MYCLNPALRALSSMKATPCRPATLAISWGSVHTVVVPQGRMARAAHWGMSMVLSTCMCE